MYREYKNIFNLVREKICTLNIYFTPYVQINKRKKIENRKVTFFIFNETIFTSLHLIIITIIFNVFKTSFVLR